MKETQSIDGGYQRFLRRPFNRKPPLSELRRATGINFEYFGVLEREILKQYGLAATDRLVDVGCGAGRLVAALQEWFTGSYVGTDVVPALLSASRDQVRRMPKATFVRIHGAQIPVADGSVDFVCMFSVLTHLQSEDAYCYLAEAQRALRIGGRVVFSFLEFSNRDHWQVFVQAVKDRKARSKITHTAFLSREAIDVWADSLNMRVVAIRDGNDPFISLPEPISLHSGVVVEGVRSFGQAICVLERKPDLYE